MLTPQLTCNDTATRPSGELIFLLMFFCPDSGTGRESRLSRLKVDQLVGDLKVVLGRYLSDEGLDLILGS